MSADLRKPPLAPRPHVEALFLPQGQLTKILPRKRCPERAEKPVISTKPIMLHSQPASASPRRLTKHSTRQPSKQPQHREHNQEEGLTRREDSEKGEGLELWGGTEPREYSDGWDGSEQEEMFGYGEELVQENELENDGYQFHLSEGLELSAPQGGGTEEQMGEEDAEEEREKRHPWGVAKCVNAPLDKVFEFRFKVRQRATDNSDVLVKVCPKEIYHTDRVLTDGGSGERDFRGGMLRESAFAKELFADRKNSNVVFTNVFCTNGISACGTGSDPVCSCGEHADEMYPDVCDAGEALADTDGLSECYLYEQTEISRTSEEEEEEEEEGGEDVYHGDVTMSSGEEGSDATDESAALQGSSSSDEEDAGGLEEREEEKDEDEETAESSLSDDTSAAGRRDCSAVSEGTSQNSTCSEVLECSSPDREPGIRRRRSGSAPPSSVSQPMSVNETASETSSDDGLGRGTRPDWWNTPGDHETEQACLSESGPDEPEPNLTSDPSSTPEQSVVTPDSQHGDKGQRSPRMGIPEAGRPEVVTVERCGVQQTGFSMATVSSEERGTDEEVSTKKSREDEDFLQRRKCHMSRSVSSEMSANVQGLYSGPDLPLSIGRASSRARCFLLHPRSYSTEHCFPRDDTPTLIGLSRCLSHDSSHPSADLDEPTTVEIPPPFELSSITKRPIRKSSPALPNELIGSCRKVDLGFKRYFLPLRFRKKSGRRSVTEDRLVSSRSSSESSPQGSYQRLDLDRHSTDSPEVVRTQNSKPPQCHASFLLYKYGKSGGVSVVTDTPLADRPLVEVGLDNQISSFRPLLISKPRSLSVPNADCSEYENVLVSSPHYENVQPQAGSAGGPSLRNVSSANDTDGYVDMCSIPGFQRKNQTSEQETESAYTICSPAIRPDGTVGVSVGVVNTNKEEGRTPKTRRQTLGCSRAFYSAKELCDSEREHVKILTLLQQAVSEDEGMMTLFPELPEIYSLHQDVHTQLEKRMAEWDQNERISDIILEKRAGFATFSTYISHYDNRISQLEQRQGEESSFNSTLRSADTLGQWLLQVIVRVIKYHVLLTDYLNNLSPDSSEYQSTQVVVQLLSDIVDQANDKLKDGENLLRLVHIEHSVLGQKDLLHPGRVFVKEGTLMKVSKKCRQPRHLFLMNDVMLYTYPQQDGKYRLINTLTLTGMEVTKPVVENVQNALRIEVKELTITLSASSCIERDDWYLSINRTLADHASVPGALIGCSEVWGVDSLCLGENAPPLLPVSQVTVCMSCSAHFSLTHRRHHCHACGKVVCRNCCKNKFALKYMKNRKAKVCDHCFSQLCKQEGDIIEITESPSRPLSAVFQNIHPTNLWRSRRGHASFCQEMSSEGVMSGTLQRSKNRKRSWRRLWFLLKDKVLYTYHQPEEKVASECLPLLGFSVTSDSGTDSSVFQLYHKTTLYYTFKAQDTHTAQRWVSAMEEATVL
ncbi:FYVE, RhoGEF and PH domain-containing protein 5b isoform X2 [Chanos chanos]|uniref:FYVE, RhoGEF and PH domain-containing protein 5b isoform X2 n=1 Tax=Chanos chanos TaxID=29144 RepID=A0A6J2VNZ8_CHACN|nr:FYVE, RhoGEF and PH domain-containing protein 5-like isoform X2 [Chanos chanos]